MRKKIRHASDPQNQVSASKLRGRPLNIHLNVKTLKGTPGKSWLFFFCNETSISVMCLKQQWSRKARCNSPREWCASLGADWQLWCSDHQDAASSPSGWKKKAERRRETRWLKMTAYDSLWFDWKQQQTWIWRKMPHVFFAFFLCRWVHHRKKKSR